MQGGANHSRDGLSKTTENFTESRKNKMGYTLEKVDFDPFAKPKKRKSGYTLEPVDFDPFADDDSAAQVPNELMAAHDQQDLVRREPLQQAHDAQYAPEPDGRLDRTFKHALGTMEDIYRPALEGLGGGLGGLAGASAGPAGMMVGGTAGYVAGKKTADWLDIYRGEKQPYESAGEVWKETLLQDVPEGMALEAGGQLVGAALVPVMKGGKWALKKITTDPIKYLFSKKWAQDQASKILVAHMGDNVIYAANREHAEHSKKISGAKVYPGADGR
jgi:hypothetical protein